MVLPTGSGPLATGTSDADGGTGTDDGGISRRQQRNIGQVQRRTDRFDDDTDDETQPTDDGQQTTTPTPVDTGDGADGGVSAPQRRNIGQLQRQAPGGTGQFQTEQDQPPGASAGDTPGDVIGTSVEQSGLVTTEVGASSGQLQQQASEYEQSLVADRPGLDPSQVDINLTQIDGEYRFAPEFSDQYRRERAARQYSQMFGPAPVSRDMTAGQQRAVESVRRSGAPDRDITAGDVQLTDDGPQLSPDLRQDIQQERATQQVERDIETQTGRDVTPGEDFTVERTADGFDVTYSDAFLEELAEQNIEVEAGRGVVSGVARLAGPGAAQAVRPSVPSGVAQQFSPVDASERYDVDVERITERQAEGIDVLANIGQTVGILPEDAETPDAGDPTFDVTLSPETTVEEADPMAVQLDERPPVQTESTTVLTEPAIRQRAREQGTEQFLPDREGLIEAGAEGLADLPGATVRASESALAYTQENIVAPTAEVTGDVAGLTQASGEFLLYGGEENARDVRQATFDIARAPSDEQYEGGFVETATEKGATGAGTAVSTVTVGLPALAETVGRTGYEAGEFTAEAIGEEGLVGGSAESLQAAGGATYTFVRSEAERAVENPYTFAGEVAGGALIGGGIGRAAGGSRLASGRTGAALRRVDVGTRSFRRGRAEFRGLADIDTDNIARDPFVGGRVRSGAERVGGRVGSVGRGVGGRVRAGGSDLLARIEGNLAARRLLADERGQLDLALRQRGRGDGGDADAGGGGRTPLSERIENVRGEIETRAQQVSQARTQAAEGAFERARAFRERDTDPLPEQEDIYTPPEPEYRTASGAPYYHRSGPTEQQLATYRYSLGDDPSLAPPSLAFSAGGFGGQVGAATVPSGGQAIESLLVAGPRRRLREAQRQQVTGATAPDATTSVLAAPGDIDTTSALALQQRAELSQVTGGEPGTGFVPEVSGFVGADVSTDITPDATDTVTPDIATDISPDVTSDVTPDTGERMTPDVTPDVSPDITPDVSPDVTPDVTPDISPDPSPDPTPDFTPDPTPDVTPDPSPDPTPRPDPTPDPRPRPDIDLDDDDDEEDELFGLQEDVGGIYADFRDPLTGDFLETERENVGITDI